jgi:hypothetical protein
MDVARSGDVPTVTKTIESIARHPIAACEWSSCGIEFEQHEGRAMPLPEGLNARPLFHAKKERGRPISEDSGRVTPSPSLFNPRE